MISLGDDDLTSTGKQSFPPLLKTEWVVAFTKYGEEVAESRGMKPVSTSSSRTSPLPITASMPRNTVPDGF